MPEIYVSEKVEDAVLKGGRLAILTPDDILTLKNVRDRLASDLFAVRDTYHRYDNIADRQLVLETLERILKQIH